MSWLFWQAVYRTKHLLIEVNEVNRCWEWAYHLITGRGFYEAVWIVRGSQWIYEVSVELLFIHYVMVLDTQCKHRYIVVSGLLFMYKMRHTYVEQADDIPNTNVNGISPFFNTHWKLFNVYCFSEMMTWWQKSMQSISHRICTWFYCLCFVCLFSVVSCNGFTHILQDYFTGTGEIFAPVPVK